MKTNLVRVQIFYFIHLANLLVGSVYTECQIYILIDPINDANVRHRAVYFDTPGQQSHI